MFRCFCLCLNALNDFGVLYDTEWSILLYNNQKYIIHYFIAVKWNHFIGKLSETHKERNMSPLWRVVVELLLNFSWSYGLNMKTLECTWKLIEKFMNYCSSELSACKLTISKTQNSGADMEFLKSCSIFSETTNAKRGEIRTAQ